MSNEKRFSQIETTARRLIEGTFFRLSGERLDGGAIATRLAQTFEELADEGKAGRTNLYEIHLHPDDYVHVLAKEPELETRLGNWLPELAAEVGISLIYPPLVKVEADEIVRYGRVLIRSEIDPNRKDDRTQMHSRRGVQAEIEKTMSRRKAWLIVNGKEHVDLNEMVMHIGRRTDNEIVIDSPTISRVHAQIRWRYNHFTLFDLGSRAGVVVNGERVDECILQSGDVIQLAEVSIVYGEGSDGGSQDTGFFEGPRTLRR